MKNKILFILIFSFISLIPITNFSLWIDEATTAYYASQLNLIDLNNKIFSARTSEIQMPGYIYYIWVWEKLFGHNEFILRLSNFPFIVILIIVIAFAPLTNRMKILLSCFFTFSPFIWYNLNEVRSTIPVFSFGGLGMLSLVYYFNGGKSLQKTGVWIFTFSLILGVSFNMLVLLFIPAIGLLFIIHSILGKWKLKTIINDWWPGLCIMGVGIGTLIIYFLWTISQGAGGYIEAPGISNTAFLFYEYLGFSGVGPPRNLLRESRSFEVLKPYIPLMGLYCSVYVILFLFIFRSLRKQSKTIQFFTNPYLITFLFGILVFSLVCSVFQFRFWGRHAIFLLPLMFFYFAHIIDHSLQLESSKYKHLFPIIPFIALTLISDINIRFNDIYKKENNKAASLKTLELVGKEGNIIWNGFDELAGYYGLNIINDPKEMPKSWPIYGDAIIPSYNIGLSDFLNNYRDKSSVLVVFNRRDFDKKGYYHDYIKNNNLSILFKDRDFSIYSME